MIIVACEQIRPCWIFSMALFVPIKIVSLFPTSARFKNQIKIFYPFRPYNQRKRTISPIKVFKNQVAIIIDTDEQTKITVIIMISYDVKELWRDVLHLDML